MALAIFGLPPAIRAQLYTTHFQTFKHQSPRIVQRHGTVPKAYSGKHYVTIQNGQTQRREEQDLPAPIRQDEDLLNLNQIMDVVKTAIDSDSKASEEEKSAVLTSLQERMRTISRNSIRKRAFKRRVAIALSDPDPLTTIQQALDANDFDQLMENTKSTDRHAGLTAQRPGKDQDALDIGEWTDLLVTEMGNETFEESSELAKLRTSEQIEKHMPTREAYSDVPDALFKILHVGNPILTMWQKYTRTSISSGDFMRTVTKNRSELPRIVASKLPAGAHGCKLSLKLPGGHQLNAAGVGPSKRSAQRAAMQRALTKLHTSGMLRDIFAKLARPQTSSPDSDTGGGIISARQGNEATQASATGLAEVSTKGNHAFAAQTPGDRAHPGSIADNQQYIQAPTSMPRKQEYPHAPDDLFDEVRCATAINSACQKLGFSMKIEGSATKLQTQGFQYDIRVNIAEHINVNGHGEGDSKQLAKREAWKDAISKLHLEGTLKQLFPDPILRDQASNEEPYQEHQERYEEQDILDIDNKVLEEQKDAKLEIYNYAASLGLFPIFKTMPIGLSLLQRFRSLTKKQRPKLQVTIKLSELNILVSATGRDLSSAEAAATLAFKRKAEEKQLVDGGEIHALRPWASKLLTVESAPQFFEMYRARYPRAKIELEQEAADVSGQALNSTKILINDVETGPPAIMRTKKEADSVAYLGAALTILGNEPDLMNAFAEAIQKGKGKVLRDVSPVDVEMSALTLSKMESTLVEARRAGLPDIRETLAAEVVPSKASKSDTMAISQKDRQAASERLSAIHTRFEEDPTLDQIRMARASLPMNGYQSQVLQLVAGSVYCIIIGATGSGKTTQVPQILFDDAIRRGEGGFCDIICTQPRRLAASSIAARVAVERNETLRETIGYHIRFDDRRPKRGGSITYCTTGLLLEQMKHDPDAILDNVSHIIIDEVHERDISIDFLLNVIRKAVASRQAAQKIVPKVILMSATLEEELFTKYFSQHVNGMLAPCPVLDVPGRMFPVHEKYLSDILDEVKSSYGKNFKDIIALDSSASADFLAAEMAFSGTISDTRSQGAIDWKREREETDVELQTVKKEKEDALVPLSLLASLIGHICKTMRDGSILAFVPGLQEITAVRDILLQNHLFGVNFNDTSKYKVCILHSAVPVEQQREVLDPVAPGCRKIILSTNIAETSVTVPDVKHVVDAGKLREKRYDAVRRITKLQCTWISDSNARQRAGRAGRVQEGQYYALYTRERRQALATSNLPELLRSDLQDVCLSIKAQGFQEPVAAFLAQSIQRPSNHAVQSAITDLQAIDALTASQELTSLGRVLSKLPVHPTLGKMVILGIIFRCLDPMLILSSMSKERSLFCFPIDARTAAKQAHAKYGESDSDQLAQLQAFEIMRRLHHEVGAATVSTYAQTNYLHVGAFRLIKSTAEQIEDILIESGLVSGLAKSRREDLRFGGEALNRYSSNTDLLKCLLLSGMHPNLGVKHAGKSRSHRTPTEGGVLMYPGSVNFKRRNDAHDQGALFAYGTLSKSIHGDALFIRESTLVTPLMAMLFGGRLRTEDWKRLEMDDWLPFKPRAASGATYAMQLILEFRKGLDRMLHSAFKSISDDEGGKSFVDNQVADQFVHGVVRVLEEGKAFESSR